MPVGFPTGIPFSTGKHQINARNELRITREINRLVAFGFFRCSQPERTTSMALFDRLWLLPGAAYFIFKK
jgi:uncharacterized protein (UPF0128 family)